MGKLSLDDVVKYVEKHISIFHKKRLDSLEKLKLEKVLRRKNPYLFKAKYVQTAGEIVEAIVDAHLSSNEETIFGDWLEGLAIYINSMVYGGVKSSSKGLDLEFNKDSIRYIVNIKSGPNWGNSSQIKKMITDFKAAKRTLRTSNSKLHIIAVNGCCYGRCPTTDKGEYFKYCGQEFWEFISGDSNLYRDIIEPIGKNAKIKNEEFNDLYKNRINLFTKEFINKFCLLDGSINWELIVKMNSGKERINV